MKRLTERELRFLDAYALNGGNGADAARTAGYYGTPRVLAITASRALARSNIAAELARRRAAIARAVDVTDADIVRETWAIAIDKAAPHAVRVSALTLLAKRSGGFATQLRRSGPSGGAIPVAVLDTLAALSDTELRRALLATPEEGESG